MDENYKQYLALFRLKESYNLSELDSRYRKLVKNLHPDINRNEAQEEAQKKMKLINEAYMSLKENFYSRKEEPIYTEPSYAYAGGYNPNAEPHSSTKNTYGFYDNTNNTTKYDLFGDKKHYSKLGSLEKKIEESIKTVTTAILNAGKAIYNYFKSYITETKKTKSKKSKNK